MIWKNKPSYILEYFGIKFILGLFLFLPWCMVMAFGWFVAFVAYYIIRVRVDEAKKRIREVFPNYKDKQVNNIAWLSYRNFIFNCMELPKLNWTSSRWLRRHCDVSAAAGKMKASMSDDRGAILALPHMGGWFVAAASAADAGIDLCAIAGVQRNPLFNKAEKDLNGKIGIDTFFRGKGEMSDVIKAIKAGKVLTVLPDVRSRIKGISVDFLGGKANLGRGVPLFAIECDVPIFPCLILREGWMKHSVEILDPITPVGRDNNEKVEHILKTLMKSIEQMIYEHPEQWFWFNKRWVLD